MTKLTIETEATYVGGSQDGKLVRPSLVKDLTTFNQTHLPAIHRENFLMVIIHMV